jgi:hypothetical protein
MRFAVATLTGAAQLSDAIAGRDAGEREHQAGAAGAGPHRGVGVIIGSAGGFFKPGRVVELGGTSYHNVLMTLVHAMGYTDVAHVGAKGTTVLDALRG